jgi:hypothetical protein
MDMEAIYRALKGEPLLLKERHLVCSLTGRGYPLCSFKGNWRPGFIKNVLVVR